MPPEPDSWPAPAVGPTPGAEIVIPLGAPMPVLDPSIPTPPPAPQPAAPQPAPKAQAQPEQDKPKYPFDPAKMDTVLQRYPEEAVAYLKERLGVNKLEADRARDSAIINYGLTREQANAIPGGTAEEILKAAAFAASLRGAQAPAQGAEQPPIVESIPSAPAPIPPPMRPAFDPATANPADLRAVAIAEPILTATGEWVRPVKSSF